MFNKLKDLVFGLSEFEKTKIEIRFELILTLIEKLKLEKLKDFEIIEECIYKIKDQLRLKSSNLNRTINDPKLSLKKRDVILILDNLNKLKYTFLEIAFDKFELNIKDNKINNVEEEKSKNQINKESKNKILIDKIDQLFSKDKVKNNKVNLNLEKNSNSNKIFENEEILVFFENKNITYLLIKFKEEIDFIILKDLSSILFESLTAHGTNIIIDKNSALIIPRFNNDKLFELPRVDSNLDISISKIKTTLKNKSNNKSNNKLKKEENEIKNNDVENEEIKNDEYIEISNNLHNSEISEGLGINSEKNQNKKKSLKEKEDSLDTLLENQLHSKKHPIKVEFDKNEKIELKKNDNFVEFELKEKEIKNSEIEIEKKQTIKNELKKVSKINYNNLIYSDNNILVTLNENSKVLGEILIKSNKNKPFSKLDENDLSYIMIFSKIFSSILFETIQAHGTNLIFNYNNNELKIIPRIEKDKLQNLTWKPQQHSDDFLEQIKTKLLQKLNLGLKSEKNEELVSKKEEINEIKQDLVESKSDIKKKAEYILDSIRRIP